MPMTSEDLRSTLGIMPRAERRRWRSARTRAELAALTAEWLEGRIRTHPGVYPGGILAGRPDPETAGLVGTLAACNRAGLLTTSSQPGQQSAPAGRRGGVFAQRPAVEGWAAPQIARDLVWLATSVGLLAVAHPTLRRPWPIGQRRSGIIVSTREGVSTCEFGGQARPSGVARTFQGCAREVINDLLCESVFIALADPAWAPGCALWAVLRAWSDSTLGDGT